jgi:hypothetical protein
LTFGAMVNGWLVSFGHGYLFDVHLQKNKYAQKLWTILLFCIAPFLKNTMSMSIINQRWHSHMNDTDTCTLIVTTICSFLDDWSLFRKVMCLNRKWHSVASRRTKLLEKVPLFVTPLESLRKAYEQFDICNNNRKKFMREYRQYSGEATELVAVETDTEYANVFDNLN